MVLATVQSESRPGVMYEIRKSKKDGRVYCTCPAWRYSKGEQKVCKHLLAFTRDPFNTGAKAPVGDWKTQGMMI